MRPISITEQLNKNGYANGLLVKCQCQHEFEVDLESSKAACSSCGQTLDWGLVK